MAMQSQHPADELRQLLDGAGLRPEVSEELLAGVRQPTPDFAALADALRARIQTLEGVRDFAVGIRRDAATSGVVPDAPPSACPESLAETILATDPARSGADIRPWILAAEDAQFAPALRGDLADWLLAFAMARRDSQDPGDAPAVWSALRTGASMLRPGEADKIAPLLEPGHPIDTSLVAVKMLGRIFEAHPPEAADAHDRLAATVAGMVHALLNPFAIDNPDCAARAQLGLHALAAMASHRLEAAAGEAARLGGWFARQSARDLGRLARRWRAASPPVRDGVLSPLERAVRALSESAGAGSAR